MNHQDYVSCDESIYNRIRKVSKADNESMQENLRIFGVLVAYSQPNMIKEDFNEEPDEFFWCHRRIKKAFRLIQKLKGV